MLVDQSALLRCPTVERDGVSSEGRLVNVYCAAFGDLAMCIARGIRAVGRGGGARTSLTNGRWLDGQ